eukprot:CAMPEP_0114233750 /NCGR_PEP_ID=MMETSP0058-20121206/5345_1 /TAXON_ID=36894 /ORGANISM="Pyramimonas parkeae, CCMP726" /LENGTH=347 /DNA_ID=CAMNT_0001345389 /DNA_START=285 /DNA_END=1328 /DNA_ORIENTATION=+
MSTSASNARRRSPRGGVFLPTQSARRVQVHAQGDRHYPPSGLPNLSIPNVATRETSVSPPILHQQQGLRVPATPVPPKNIVVRGAGSSSVPVSNGKPNGQVPMLLVEMDHTMLELQEKEALAARGKQYKVAEALQRAVADLEALKAEYQDMVVQETQAVRARDYVRAAAVKKRQTWCLRKYAGLRRRDFFSDGPAAGEEGPGGEPPAPTSVAVRFHLTHALQFGQQMMICGSLEELGMWNAKNAQPMQWTNGDEWVCTVNLPPGTKFQFKFVVSGPVGDEGEDGFFWQDGENREYELPMDTTKKVDVSGSWFANPQKEVVWVCYPLGSVPEEPGQRHGSSDEMESKN